MAETARYHGVKQREGQSSGEFQFFQTFEEGRPTRRKWIILIIIGILLIILLVVSMVLSLTHTQASKSYTYAKARVFQDAAVATDSEICSKVGADILRKKGNAVDSAVAVLFCLGVVNLHSCGIGGGTFMVVYLREEKKHVLLDFREEAPGSASERMYVNTTKSSRLGGSAIAVPGEVKGLWIAHQRYGKLKWADLLEPSIRIAEDGFPVTETIQVAIDSAEKTSKTNPSFDMSGLRQLLSDGKGGLIKLGDTLRNPKLAATLRNIQKHNATGFYEGDLAKRIVNDVKKANGNITLEDLKNYKVKERDAVKLKLPNNLTLTTMSAPSGGPIVALILNILSGYDFSEMKLSEDDDMVDYYQKLVESMKFAYAQRGYLGDPSFVPMDNISMVVNKASDRNFGKSIRQKISLTKTFNSSHYGGTWAPQYNHGTSHMSIIAPNGDAVAATATINLLFGSKVYSTDTGIIYNNEMDDFSTPGAPNAFKYPPSPANFIRPGKRPLSSMSPAIVTDSNGDVKMVCGASGGSRIITGTAQVLSKKLFLDMELGEAVDSFRVHHQGVPNEILYNVKPHLRPPEHLINALRKIGHRWRGVTSTSVVQAIYQRDNKLYAKSDIRKGGKSAGF